MTNSGNPKWDLARRVEAALFMLGDVDDRRKVIRAQAWHEANWTAVYQEATAMKATVAEMRATLSDVFTQLAEEARQ